MKKLLLIILLSVTSLAYAEDEAKIACDLARAQADVIASELKYPSVFASVGDPSVDQQSIALGMSQSISGIYRAYILINAADAQCKSVQIVVKFDQFVIWSKDDIRKKGAVASLLLINDAIDMAISNVKIINDQLAAKVSTVANLNAAEILLETLYKTKSNLLSTIAVEIPSTEFSDISNLLYEYQKSERDAAELAAKASANSGWDIAIAAGARKPIGIQTDNSSRDTSPFITANIRYSFGTHASIRAAENVGRNTKLLIQNRQLGYNKIFERQKKEFQALADIETTNIQVATKELEAIRQIRTPLENIKSSLAQDMRRILDIQIKTIEADLSGAKVRLESINALLTKMSNKALQTNNYNNLPFGAMQKDND